MSASWRRRRVAIADERGAAQLSRGRSPMSESQRGRRVRTDCRHRRRVRGKYLRAPTSRARRTRRVRRSPTSESRRRRRVGGRRSAGRGVVVVCEAIADERVAAPSSHGWSPICRTRRGRRVRGDCRRARLVVAWAIVDRPGAGGAAPSLCGRSPMSESRRGRRGRRSPTSASPRRRRVGDLYFNNARDIIDDASGSSMLARSRTPRVRQRPVAAAAPPRNMQLCARTSGVLGALKDASLRSRRMAAGFARP